MAMRARGQIEPRFLVSILEYRDGQLICFGVKNKCFGGHVKDLEGATGTSSNN